MTSNMCPLCKNIGQEVQRDTVENLTKDYFKKHLKALEYNICMNKECSIVYFNSETDEIYFERDLKVPVDFKNNENPIICYCANITLQDIINEIIINKTSNSLEDIMINTGAGRGIRCKSTNPSGKCCKDLLEKSVDYALGLRSNEK